MRPRTNPVERTLDDVRLTNAGEVLLDHARTVLPAADVASSCLRAELTPPAPATMLVESLRNGATVRGVEARDLSWLDAT